MDLDQRQRQRDHFNKEDIHGYFLPLYQDVCWIVNSAIRV